MIPIYPYQTREVRDLAWACFSPALLQADQLADSAAMVADCDLPLTPARMLWLEQLDRDTGELLNHLAAQRSHRLGVYFEHLWHFFLAQDPAIELVAHNLPIRDGGQTLGEFDCLYFCRERQRHFHLELAVKFFLGCHGNGASQVVSQWRQWLGPNTEDRLDLKIAHLMRRQIQLGEHPLARQQLEKLGITELSREVVIKGYLFQPALEPLPPPPAFNPEAKLEQWLPIDRLPLYLQSLDTDKYLVLPKSHWLATVCASAQQREDSVTGKELDVHLRGRFSHDARPQLVAALDTLGHERRRFFVTPRYWPQQDEAR